MSEILPNLPDRFHPDRGDEFPEDLLGSTIVRIGTIAEQGLVEGGGLVIDYRPAGSEAAKRLVLAFNDLGMWIETKEMAGT
jgi:hypothetical protein